MNSSSGPESTNQPDLILKLCNHVAKNKPVLSANLCKIAFSFLSSSVAVAPNVPSDEQYIIVQIRQILSAQSKENAEHFELLYSNICKTSVLQNRCSVLSFLLKLAKMSQKEVKWNTVESLEKFPSTIRPKSHLALKSGNSQESIRSIFQGHCHNSVKSVQSSSTNIQSSCLTAPSSTADLSLITERDLLQDIIYSFQGIEGRFLRKEVGNLGFTVDPKAGKNLTPIQRGLVERLTGMSFLHNQLKQYCDNNDEQGGVICLALVATLREELSAYYKTIALLQTALKKQVCIDQPQMTLRKSLVYIHEHRVRFEWLAYIAEQCNDKKGGALVTAVHGFLQHGSKCAQEVSEKVLTAVCKPLYIMLWRWLLDGEINDSCNEFFIEARDITAAERLWHDKYHVRKSMVPSFITMDQAKKILATGKSINFLRQICKDSGQLPGRDALQKLSRSTSAEALFAPEQSLEFDATLEKVYRETSLRVLDLLKNKYRLFEHLQSLRRYLLLGQGDFIRHLLELLVPELNKPAQEIYNHTLSAILESAIRVTNAQFEDEDTLQRLTVSFMGHSQGDTGWDVFSLVYIVDGPVGTIFQPTMTTYQCLFGALWKAKRMEFVLANMRKQQITMAKKFRKIKELQPVMHIIHILTSEMIHFLHQTQYYFLFEVLECSWAEMLRQVNHAECLDDIIGAHTIFLNSVQCGVLLDESSRQLFSQLRSIYNFILNLEGHQEALNEAATREYETYLEFTTNVESSVNFGITTDEEIKAKARVENFHQFINSIRTKVKHLSQTYKQFVKKYLILLSTSSNMNLQLLSVRLSFNDYYKII
ncbi:gamma-tubulin complex component 3 [Asbolus verrucosus]|uniref:Gamma-tubulin complex component 3 n=1 Tax=Asbolus verrucosus TaxID=1661398 RepID=A0A482VA44_ASBVE|nr:gamma-tubulin complex component 3 [Asbolus verrucosus]